MVLVIERDKATRDTFFYLFRAWGIDVEMVETPGLAMQRLSGDKYDLILLDTANLLEAETFVKEWRKTAKGTKLVLLSTLTRDKAAALAEYLGVPQLIRKPFSLNTLENTLLH